MAGFFSRWFRRTPGPDVLARWTVDEALARGFRTAEHWRQGLPPNELPLPEPMPPGGVEVVAEPEALWLGRRRFKLPLRGAPEVLRAQLDEPAGGLATLELTLKYPPRPTSRGGIEPASYARITLPVPATAAAAARQAAAHFNRDLPGTPDFFHGPGDGSDPEDLSTCPACGFQTHKFRSQCERCGAGLQSRRWARRFGGMLVLCGLVLTGLMGAVLWFTLPILWLAMFGGGSAAFSGSPGQAAVVVGVLGAVFVFGATCLGYGAWQVATGRHSLKVAGYVVTLASALVTAAAVVPALLR